jgi:hypothetical protein
MKQQGKSLPQNLHFAAGSSTYDLDGGAPPKIPVFQLCTTVAQMSNPAATPEDGSRPQARAGNFHNFFWTEPENCPYIPGPGQGMITKTDDP